MLDKTIKETEINPFNYFCKLVKKDYEKNSESIKINSLIEEDSSESENKGTN